MPVSKIVNAARGAIQDTVGFAVSNGPLGGLLGGTRPGNISDFKSQMTTPAMTTQFDVVITLPTMVQDHIRQFYTDSIDIDRVLEGLRFKTSC